jgi:hypothetical protein
MDTRHAHGQMEKQEDLVRKWPAINQKGKLRGDQICINLDLGHLTSRNVRK